MITDLFSFVGYDGLGRAGRQAVAAVQTLQLEQTDDLDDLRAQLFHQMYRRLERAARCDQIVNDDHAQSRRDVLAVHLDLRRAVFEVIRDARGRARQLAALANRNKGLVQIVCHRHAEQEAPRICRSCHRHIFLFCGIPSVLANFRGLR